MISCDCVVVIIVVVVLITFRRTVAEASRGRPGGGTGYHCAEGCPGCCEGKQRGKLVCTGLSCCFIDRNYPPVDVLHVFLLRGARLTAKTANNSTAMKPEHNRTIQMGQITVG